MEKWITDANAENINKNQNAIREVTTGMPFSAKQSEWDTKCKISYEDLRESGCHGQRGEADGKHRKGDGQQSRERSQIQKKR